jgi:tRNA-dihydrouridine synthase B
MGDREDNAPARSLGERAPVAVQLAGSDPAMLAEAARYNVDRGAQIIDISMVAPRRSL